MNSEQVHKYFDKLETRSGISTKSIQYWQNHIVYYTFATGFTHKQNVLDAIEEWTNKTSLTFREGTGNGDYIEFFHDDNGGNYSNSIGKKGGKNFQTSCNHCQHILRQYFLVHKKSSG